MPQNQPNPAATGQMAHPQQQTYNYAAAMANQAVNQMNANHLRPMMHGHPSALMPHFAAAGGAQVNAATGQQGQPNQPGQDHTAAHPPQIMQFPMYSMNYAGMQMQPGQRMGAPSYWSVGIGRGAPHPQNPGQMPGMPGHQPQPMPVGAQKAAAAGGAQGS